MNKPAPKEPSMDEILSSIRQIIADDDAAPSMPPAAAAVPPGKPAAPQAAAPRPSPVPRPAAAAAPIPQPVVGDPMASEPLTLSAAQIMSGSSSSAHSAPLSFDALIEAGGSLNADIEAPSGAPQRGDAQLVEPDDITFASDEEPEMATPAAAPIVASIPAAAAPAAAPTVAARPSPAPASKPRPSPTPAEAAPMPDPMLSADMADELLEPTTNAAVRQNFAKLNSLTTAAQGQTVEAITRELLRPMLKDWLDENLPAVVERMVEKEISRISRGE